MLATLTSFPAIHVVILLLSIATGYLLSPPTSSPMTTALTFFVTGFLTIVLLAWRGDIIRVYGQQAGTDIALGLLAAILGIAVTGGIRLYRARHR